MTHTVIVGSGFASCTAIKSLRKQGYRDQITVVAPKAELFYYPSLIWVPAGKRDESDLRVDLTGFYRKYDVKHQAASASGLDAGARVLKTDQGDMAFDYLIIASGGRYIRKLPG
ncbi:MAG: FAD-dependent oxidoreductase, partial [Gammaproteobacteria bacterium]